MYIHQNIAYYRKLCGYTQEQLAERLGVTGQAVSKWENAVSNPDISVLPDLAKTLGVDINALFEQGNCYLQQKDSILEAEHLPYVSSDSAVSLSDIYKFVLLYCS